ALVASLVAVSQQGRAEREEREAALRALISRSEALRSTRRDLAALLAVEAYRLAPGPDTESALFGTFTASPGVERVVRVDAGYLQAGAIMSDGGTAALVDQRGSVHLVDLARGAVTAVLESRHADEAVSYVARSADGRYFAVASFRVKPTGEFADETHDELTVWDVRTGRRRFPDIPLPFHPGSVAFSPDGSLVAVGGGEEGRVSVYDAATGAHRLDVEPVPRPSDAFLLVSTVAVAFGPDGNLIIGAEAGPIRIVDPTTGRVRQRIEAPPLTAHYLLRVSSDERLLTTAGVEGVAHYDLATRTTLWTAEPPGGCNSLIPAERIGVLLCGEYSGTVLAIDLATGAIVGRRFDSHQGTVHDLLISPDGTTLLEVMSSAPVYVQWRLDGGGPVSRAVTDIDTTVSVTYLDERLVVTTNGSAESSGAGDVRIIDGGNGEALDPLADIKMAAPMPDRTRLAAVFTDGTVGAYDLDRRARSGAGVDVGFVPEGITTIGDRALVWAGGRLQGIDLDRAASVPPEVDQEAVINVAVAPDSNHLLTLDGFYGLLQRRDSHTGDSLGEGIPGFNLLAATGGTLVANTSDGQLLVLDPDRLTAVGAPLPAITGPAAAMALSGDGRRLAVLGADRALRFYDVPSRTQLGDELPVGREGAAVAIRADGLQAAAATDQGVVIWDLVPDHWVEAACLLAGRNLTRAEWDFHLGDLARYRPTCPDYPAG
ncbi:MAG TPA: WD40 repeat domain-containing protein, partial [Jiangellaceae bacterium]